MSCIITSIFTLALEEDVNYPIVRALTILLDARVERWAKLDGPAFFKGLLEAIIFACNCFLAGPSRKDSVNLKLFNNSEWLFFVTLILIYVPIASR